MNVPSAASGLHRPDHPLRSRTIWLCASAFALLHLLVVGGTLVRTGGSGESQGYLVAIADFPLVMLLNYIPDGVNILYDSGPPCAYIWFFSIVGTLMYATTGFAAGLLVRKVTQVLSTWAP